MNQLQELLEQDIDPTESKEWVEALTAVINADGPERAHYLLEKMVDETRRAGGHIPFAPTTAYVNTIPPQAEAKSTHSRPMASKRETITAWRRSFWYSKISLKLFSLSSVSSYFERAYSWASDQVGIGASSCRRSVVALVG